MATTLSLPQLSLDLPSVRMSVNFDTFTAGSNTGNHKYENSNTSRVTRKPLPTTSKQSRRHGYVHGLSLAEVTEELEHSEHSRSRRDSVVGSGGSAERWNLDQLFLSVQNAYVQSRTASPAPSKSSVSVQSEPVRFRATSPSATRTPSPTLVRPKNLLASFQEQPLNISTLPQSLLEHILSYVLPITETISIGSVSMEHRHMQYRYHRPSLEYMDLRQAMKHPLFSVSHRIRTVALETFYQKCLFTIDLASIYYTNVASTADENLKRQQKFWIDEPPKIVQDSLQRLAKLHIRLPVPSTEPGVRRGREEDDWMDGSDGNGGGSLIINSLKKEQEDAHQIQKCLNGIVQLLTTPPTRSPQRNRSFGGRQRSRSRSSSRSNGSDDEKRAPLKRLEIVLVKRSSRATIQPEVIHCINALRTLQVTGFTKYSFELKGHIVQWATKYRQKWKGMEPNNAKLIEDLQALTIPDPPVDPICTPVEFKFTTTDKRGRLALVDAALPKTPITLDAPKRDTSREASKRDASKESPRRDASRDALKREASMERELPPIPVTPKPVLPWNPLAMLRKKSHKHDDSYTMIMAEGMGSGSSGKSKGSAKEQPPTIEELQKIADDIRNGLY